jgi:hypothetical protein
MDAYDLIVIGTGTADRPSGTEDVSTVRTLLGLFPVVVHPLSTAGVAIPPADGGAP